MATPQITTEELVALLAALLRAGGQRTHLEHVVPDDAGGAAWADLIALRERQQQEALARQLGDVEGGRWYAVRVTRSRRRDDAWLPGTAVRTAVDVVPLDGGRLPEGEL